MSENEFSVNEFIVRETGYPGAIKQEVVGELVRCKDCKHNMVESDSGIVICEIDMGLYPLNGFCSRWERSEE